MQGDFLDLARRIQASIREAACRGRQTERIGPFVATFNRDDSNLFLNYAIPDEGVRPSADDVSTLVDAYRKRMRTPRLEYLPVLAPAVEPALVAAGFEIEGRLPLMTCGSPASVRESDVPGIELVAPTSDEEYRGVASVQWEAYDEKGEPPQRLVDGLRRTAEGGGVVVLARDSETLEPAGAGLCTAPHDGVAELTSVGVRETFRRRGIAAALTGWLARGAFDVGMNGVFLMAKGGAEVRIYERAGFETRSDVLHISRKR
jgi:ribosomal protein S18 acetylase RimI-like enzyme